MDRSNVKSDRGLRRVLARMHQLLRYADGGALAGDGHDKIRRHHAQIGQAPCLDRARELRQDRARGTARLEEAAAHFRQFNVRLFQDKADEAFIRQVWSMTERACWHSFQVLTKRPERMLEILSKPEFPTLPNVWLGTSVESEDYLDRIDLLRRVPARIRFVSFEPPLGPIADLNLSGIHWTIVVGEYGPCARPLSSG